MKTCLLLNLSTSSAADLLLLPAAGHRYKYTTDMKYKHSGKFNLIARILCKTGKMQAVQNVERK